MHAGTGTFQRKMVTELDDDFVNRVAICQETATIAVWPRGVEQAAGEVSYNESTVIKILGRKIMVTCPVCDGDIDVDEEEVDEGDTLSCDECGASLKVLGKDPLELESADEEEDDDDEDLDDDDDDEEDEDDDEEEEDEEDDDWK